MIKVYRYRRARVMRLARATLKSLRRSNKSIKSCELCYRFLRASRRFSSTCAVDTVLTGFLSNKVHRDLITLDQIKDQIDAYFAENLLPTNY